MVNKKVNQSVAVFNVNGVKRAETVPVQAKLRLTRRGRMVVGSAIVALVAGAFFGVNSLGAGIANASDVASQQNFYYVLPVVGDSMW
ncbi:MAG: hypothetical protein Q4C71_01535, partial [Microbacteriaceae bacterium]|nr:hypothetical protein [Microbacteriaceae bacterium]